MTCRSALCELCHWEGCSSYESSCWRGSTFIRGSGLSIDFWLVLKYSFEVFKFHSLCLFFLLLYAALSRIPWQVWEEVCNTRCIWHPEHFPVTWPGMDIASHIPSWTSPPYSCKDLGSILQQGCHPLICLSSTKRKLISPKRSLIAWIKRRV